MMLSQRFKCAGMKWKVETGASILALRVIALSRIWSEARDAMLESQKTICKQLQVNYVTNE